MPKDTRKTFEFLFSLLVAVTLTSGLYLSLLTITPGLPAWSALGLHPVDVGKVLSQTSPGARGNRLFIYKLGLDVPIAAANDATALGLGVWPRQPTLGSP